MFYDIKAYVWDLAARGCNIMEESSILSLILYHKIEWPLDNKRDFPWLSEACSCKSVLEM